MLKDGELAAEGDDHPYVLKNHRAVSSLLRSVYSLSDSYQRHHERVPTSKVGLDGVAAPQWSERYSC